ncbi:MAG: TIR domain-containing protein [Streptosporangiaceae bacterium]
MDALDPALFIGSSSEGLAIARALQMEVDEQCEPTVWSQDVFLPGGTTLADLLAASQNSDFAALILTPDDSVVSRGEQRPAARDNVIFELGLFLGALGPQRVFIIRPRGQELRLPSDLAGVTILEYRYNRRDQNLRAAIGPAATEIQNRISAEGLRSDRGLVPQAAPAQSAGRRGLTINEEQRELNRELDAIEKAARAQGWLVKTRSDTAFRLVATNKNRYSFPIGSPAETRDRLRSFAQQLQSAGLRVSQPVLKPVNEPS